MRVSDAERSEVADALSKHYSDGRLDEAEFNERLQKAMSAKTRGDFAGLLADLPPITPPPPPEPQVRHRRTGLALGLVALIMVGFAVASPYWSWHVPWILLAVVLFVLWRRSKWAWHRHRHDGWHGHGPVQPWPNPGPGQYPSPGDASAPDAGPGFGRGRGWWV